MNWIGSLLGKTDSAEYPSSDADGMQTKDADVDYAESGEDQKQRQIALHKIDAKLTAITRATLRLSENSYSCDQASSSSQEDLIRSPSDDKPSNKSKAPKGWNEQYNELYSLLKRGLLGYDPSVVSVRRSPRKRQTERNIHNVSAVLMGPRGEGKSFILERCLANLSLEADRLRGNGNAQLQKPNTTHQEQQQAEEEHEAFRVVRLNGLLYSGDNAVACAREIARQINEMARTGKRNKKRLQSDDGNDQKKRARLKFDEAFDLDTENKEHQLFNNTTPLHSPDEHNDIMEEDARKFRHRRTGFNTNLALLDEALRNARIDNIPILIILEELDTFIAKGRMLKKSQEDKRGNPAGGDGNERQLLLYHLLDRVADNRFLVSLVGITTDLTTVSKFEKRVLSRAEGTSKFLYCGRMSGYDDLVDGLMTAFHSPHRMNLSLPEISSEGKALYATDAMVELSKEVEWILRGGDHYGQDKDEIDDYTLVRRVLERNYHVKNMDMRWFCRVLDVALGLYASDVEANKSSGIQDTSISAEATTKLTPSHLCIALNSMGASICDVVRTSKPGMPSFESLMLLRWGQLLGDPNHFSTLVGNDPRLRVLLDLSGPQCAILLAARRILARDDICETEDAVINARKTGAGGSNKTDTSMAAPLTYQRICDEYTTSFAASGRYTAGSDRYLPHILQRACIDLIELDLIRLKKDHLGGGPLQYEYCDALSKGSNIMTLPLHVNLEMDDEFMPLLKAGVLHCSTALREWGLKIS